MLFLTCLVPLTLFAPHLIFSFDDDEEDEDADDDDEDEDDDDDAEDGVDGL